MLCEFQLLFSNLFPECVAGRFGSNCDQKCGMCMSNAVCDYRSGTCPQGCAEGWAGAKCQLGKTASTIFGTLSYLAIYNFKTVILLLSYSE